MINNKIIELYKQGYYENEIIDIETGEIITQRIRFDSRNLAIYIGLKFLDRMNFFGFIDEIAKFMNMSTKRIKDRLTDLENIKIEMNNEYNTVEDKHVLLEKPRCYPLISKRKEKGYEGNKQVETNRWYTPFNCDLKEIRNPDSNEIELKAHKFFIVTIYDFDLFLNGILDEHEFALYLYLVQCFNSDKDNKGIAQSISKIAENMNVKDTNIIQRRLDKLINLRVTDKYCSIGEDFPLIHTSKPKNYNHKLITRQEPSLHFYPIYNDTTIAKINNIEPEPYSHSEVKVDTDQNNLDTHLKGDSDFNNLDTNFNNVDSDFGIWDTNDPF
jgi:hypothetical protein